MGGAHRSLEWLARRRDGESMALIAWRDGVSPQTVKRVTAPYGPFPAPSRLLGKTITVSTVLAEQRQRWVDARRHGQRVTDIARREGVAHQLVSRYTAQGGPYPCPQVVQEWVQARQAGRKPAEIANTYGASEGLVIASTRPWGPFRPPGPRLPEGVVGVAGLARMAGVSGPTAVRWVRTHRAPAPDFVIGHDRQLWLSTTIARWLEADDALGTCPDCGARSLSVSRHRSAKHGPRAATA